MPKATLQGRWLETMILIRIKENLQESLTRKIERGALTTTLDRILKGNTLRRREEPHGL
jgi:hypothetical protein